MSFKAKIGIPLMATFIGAAGYFVASGDDQLVESMLLLALFTFMVFDLWGE